MECAGKIILKEGLTPFLGALAPIVWAGGKKDNGKQGEGWRQNPKKESPREALPLLGGRVGKKTTENRGKI
jgi:hypothetical protein